MFRNAKIFIKDQTANIILTILGGIIPIIISNSISLFSSNDSKNINITISVPHDTSQEVDSLLSLLVNDIKLQNYMFQSFLILITLFVLIRIQKFVVNDVNKSQKQIKRYILKNCGLKIYDREKNAESAFQIVKKSVSQFFNTWLLVWMMWLVYYGGAVLIYSNTCSCNKIMLDIYQQIFDFLNSTALFAIYIILNSVTVNSKERTHKDYYYLDFILVWTVLLIVFIAGVLIEIHAPHNLLAGIMPFYVSAFSTITFVLVLGKMNSSYLKIPQFFMLILYIYAITQLYVPLIGCDKLSDQFWFKNFLGKSLPYVTLFGKLFLMLTICWIAVQRRFIFFVIHRSTTIDKIDDLMSELNKENVSF